MYGRALAGFTLRKDLMYPKRNLQIYDIKFSEYGNYQLSKFDIFVRLVAG
jgi:hypothetical protein